MENSNEQSQGQTIKCPSCKEAIQLGAKKCKHCGADLRNWFVRHKVITGILIIIGIGIIGSAMGGNETKNTSDSSSTTNNVQEAKSTADVKAEADTKVAESVPAEYKSALSQAETYANTMHLSKQGVYDQLVSEYGGKFPKEAAQYAIDNVKADWNANALSQAKTYRDTMHLSTAAVRDQLISEYGAKFTKVEADYAIQHLND
ncbi:Ltp family lipoprotein [bacterium]|nr:MAG: Ltp family lipoprotein [bacterium]